MEDLESKSGSTGGVTQTMSSCPEYSRLEQEVRSVVQSITLITSASLEAFQAGDDEKFKRLDQELEKAVGQKERCVGALKQHAKDHGCRFR